MAFLGALCLSIERFPQDQQMHVAPVYVTAYRGNEGGKGGSSEARRLWSAAHNVSRSRCLPREEGGAAGS